MRSYVILFTLISFFFSCSGSKKTVDLAPSPNEKTAEAIPGWYLNIPQDPNFVFSAQTATSREMGMAVKKATQSARAEIAMQIDTKVKALEKMFREEVGFKEDSEYLEQFTEVNESVSTQTLIGSQVVKRETKPEESIWRAYVLMQMPLGMMQKEFVDEVKKREILYNRYRASEGFKELEEKTQKYEAEKNK
jgi:hypothetical protein